MHKIIFLLLCGVLTLGYASMHQKNQTLYFFSENETKHFSPLRYLTIPKIAISAQIESNGLTLLGAMVTPERPDATSWFNLGTYPGEIGTAVIAGHYGWQNGESAVFDNLHTLQKGDQIQIESIDGRVSTFIVRESRLYHISDDTSDVFFSNDGISHLNLITCAGKWNKKERSYSNRLVVFSDKID